MMDFAFMISSNFNKILWIVGKRVHILLLNTIPPLIDYGGGLDPNP